MLLHNAKIVGKDGVKHILIENGIVQELIADEAMPEFGKNDTILDCTGAIVFPGLINSHDHLDFNLFPRMGNRRYNNYTEWGNEIQIENKKEIDAVLKIPKQLRIQWGVYKNLLNGVTTIINHGEQISGNNLVTVFENCYPLHSVGFEKNWRWKLNDPLRKVKPFVVHVGEGTDEVSRNEINRLLQWNLFKKRIVGVHGVAMSDRQARKFAALVWCPESNYFLLDKTAPIHSLKNHTKILFGTDSTLTAGWNLWEQLRLAREEKALSDDELFDVLTISAAETWSLDQKGKISPGYDADIVIAKPKENKHDWNAFYELNPEDIQAVFHKGEVCLFDSEIKQEIDSLVIKDDYSKVELNGVIKYIKGDLPGLVREIRRYYPGAKIPVSCT